MSCNGTDAVFLHDVDVGSNSSVNIIYFINEEDKLPHFLSNLQQLLCDNIHFAALQLLYRFQGSLPGLLNRRRVSQFEKDYLTQLKDEFQMSKPQESQPPPTTAPTNAWKPTQQAQQVSTPQMNDLSTRLKSIESFIDESKKNQAPNKDAQLASTEKSLSSLDISSMISTQISSATSSIQTEFNGKLNDVSSRLNIVEESITVINSTTARLDSSINKLEETNSKLLEFLKQNHTIPASGQLDVPRAKD